MTGSGRAFVLLCASVSPATSYFLAPFLVDNKDALNALVTAFTVFGGFLIGIITLTGDPTMIPAGSWRTAEKWRGRIEAPLSRQRALFYLYILTLALVMTSLVIIEPNPPHRVDDNVKLWLARVDVAFATFSFLLTLALPEMMVKLQKDRFDREVESRRTNDKIGSRKGH